ncbi:MAG TPA: hypothetical protein VFB80_09445 [Pirellulaceae bacterium]|nr:hypothetical protein [Pirellulaceae bacterium]
MLTLLLLQMLAAADEPASDDQQRREAVARLAPAKAKQMNVLVGDQEPVQAALVEKPLLRWSNPTAGSVFGEVYLWTSRERPVAIASIYRWYHPFKDSTVEVVSLSSRPVQAREGEAALWQSPADGVTWQKLASAPRPAETANARLGQMRSLAREFSAELADQRSGEQVARELRLLNQPVHRYASPESGVIDGALFAFVETTDPEAWLLLEAAAQEGQTGWRFALARMNADELRIKRGGELAAGWSKIVQPWRYRSAPYTLFGFDPDQVKIEPERN